MDKRIIFLFMASIIIFIIVIFSINILIERYARESGVSEPHLKMEEKPTTEVAAPVEKSSVPEVPEEPERESPISAGEPLLD